MTTYIPWLDDESLEFPPTSEALEYPNGLLAAGGDLTPNRLIRAYAQGIFPWFSEDEPIMWWSPTPRCVIYPEHFHASKSLRKLSRKDTYQVRFNKNFLQVIEECSKERADQAGTWITEDMKLAYFELHQMGFAHSVEVYRDEQLVGGLYGVGIGGIFFGESMFSSEPNTSKLAIYKLSELMKAKDLPLIDCQVTSDHLLTLGAAEIDRDEFENTLSSNLTTYGLTKIQLSELNNTL